MSFFYIFSSIHTFRTQRRLTSGTQQRCQCQNSGCGQKKAIIRRFDIQRDRHVGPSSAALYILCLERRCQVRNREARARKKSSMHKFLLMRGSHGGPSSLKKWLMHRATLSSSKHGGATESKNSIIHMFLLMSG